MPENDWNVTNPIDHTLIGDVPEKIRDVKSSSKIIIAKEHVTPSTDNSGGQHVKGSSRVYLESGHPTTDPEGNNLETSTSTLADDGRLSVDTASSNHLKVYVGTSAGISTGWEEVRVGRVKASEDLDANSNRLVNLSDGTASGQAVHLGQIDTSASTGQLKMTEPSTSGKFGVAVLDPPTVDGHVAGKKYVDDEITTHESAGHYTEASEIIINNTNIGDYDWHEYQLTSVNQAALCVFSVTIAYDEFVAVRPAGGDDYSISSSGAGCNYFDPADAGDGGYIICPCSSTGKIDYCSGSSSQNITLKLVGYIV